MITIEGECAGGESRQGGAALKCMLGVRGMGNVLWQQPWPAAPLMRMRDPPPPPPPPSSSGSCSMRPPCPHSHVLPLSYSSSPTSPTHHSHPYAASLPPSLGEAAMPPSHCSFPPCAAIVPARPAPMQVVSAPSVPPTRASQAKATCLAHRSRSPSLRGPIMDHAVLYIERKSFSFPLSPLPFCRSCVPDGPLVHAYPSPRPQSTYSWVSVGQECRCMVYTACL